MRISTSQFYESTSATYQNNFSSVVKTQTQIDSGVRIQSAGDDPAGARIEHKGVGRVGLGARGGRHDREDGIGFVFFPAEVLHDLARRAMHCRRLQWHDEFRRRPFLARYQ